MKNALLIIVFFLGLQEAKSQYQHDSIKVDHGYLHYYTKGRGKPVVLLQGNTGSSSYYMRMISDTLNAFQTILVDYQGTGRSRDRKIEPSWINTDQIIEDYELVRQHLKIDQWTLIGHSYGGQHALYYATKYPRKTTKVITIGGVTSDNQSMKYWFDNMYAYQTDEERQQIAALSSDRQMSPVSQKRRIMELFTRAAFFNKEKAKLVSDYYPDEEVEIALNPSYQEVWRGNPDFYTFDFSKELYALKTPIRLIQGRQDPIGEGLSVLLNERAKNSKLAFIEQSSHFPWVEQSEQFYKVLHQFLND